MNATASVDFKPDTTMPATPEPTGRFTFLRPEKTPAPAASTMDGDPALLPCPFCGSPATFSRYNERQTVGCSNPVCLVRPSATVWPHADPDFAADDDRRIADCRARAAHDWNTRA